MSSRVSGRQVAILRDGRARKGQVRNMEKRTGEFLKFGVDVYTVV
jgi:hypothetical protein